MRALVLTLLVLCASCTDRGSARDAVVINTVVISTVVVSSVPNSCPVKAERE